jgi:hypothetical protein
LPLCVPLLFAVALALLRLLWLPAGSSEAPELVNWHEQVEPFEVGSESGPEQGPETGSEQNEVGDAPRLLAPHGPGATPAWCRLDHDVQLSAGHPPEIHRPPDA